MSKIFTSKAERETHYRAQLASSPQWAIRALLVIYSLQTSDEQSAGHTSALNGRGFSGRDSEILSSFARRVIEWNAEATHKYPTPMSSKQLIVLFRCMPRYAVQLIEHLEAAGTIPRIVAQAAQSKAEAPTAILPVVADPAAAADIAAMRQRRATPQIPALTAVDVAVAAERVEARQAQEGRRAVLRVTRTAGQPVDLVALAALIPKA